MPAAEKILRLLYLWTVTVIECWGSLAPQYPEKELCILSVSVKKSMTKDTLPLKGKDTVTVTVSMESDLVTSPRDILIAWDYFGQNVGSVYLRDTESALRMVLEKLVGLTGGANGRLGGGNRVALYGNRENTGEIRTAFTDDTAVLTAALDDARANPQTGLAIVTASMVEMLEGAVNRKTALICGLRKETALLTAEREKLTRAGIEIFTMGALKAYEAEPWGGVANSSTDGQGPAFSMAGMHQNLYVVDEVSQQFRAREPMNVTTGDVWHKGPVQNRPYRMHWEMGLPEAKTGVQTQTMTYDVENLGPDLGQQVVTTLHLEPHDIHRSALGELTDLAEPELKVTITGDPTPGEGGGTDPEPSPESGVVQAEAWPDPTPVTVDPCRDAVQTTVPDAQLLSLGRLVQLDVVLKNICPGKRVSATVMLTEIDPAGLEQTRAVKHILVPAQTGTTCADVTLRCIQFSVPEALDVSGDASLCGSRSFNARVPANYVARRHRRDRHPEN